MRFISDVQTISGVFTLVWCLHCPNTVPQVILWPNLSLTTWFLSYNILKPHRDTNTTPGLLMSSANNLRLSESGGYY